MIPLIPRLVPKFICSLPSKTGRGRDPHGHGYGEKAKLSCNGSVIDIAASVKKGDASWGLE